MMKKLCIAASAALLLSVTPAQAGGFANDLQFGAGASFVDLGHTSSSAILFYGTVEKELDVDLGNFDSVAQLRLGTSTAASTDVPTFLGSYKVESSVDYLISGLFKSSMDIQNNIAVYAMLGFSYASVTSTVTGVISSPSTASSDSSLSYGFGADYEVNRDLKVGIEYTTYFADVNGLAVNAYFDF